LTHFLKQTFTDQPNAYSGNGIYLLGSRFMQQSPRYPNLNLIPANAEADVNDFEVKGKSTGAKQVQILLGQTDALPTKHRVQDARKILDQQATEVRITTTSSPLDIYPLTIKDAAHRQRQNGMPKLRYMMC
jgi:hypothetical protein